MTGLATLPPRCIQEPLVVRDMDRRPLAGHCLSVCNGSALLGDPRRVSISVERDFLSILFIYPRIFLSVFICIVSY